eukprot:GEZU01043512.1.p2 GENE.GEZU01043512.1~~GEZU01043512.1.p2  ORF type:complete len:406 (+),score=174.15 GEZU01043512.1:100-1317(+)
MTKLFAVLAIIFALFSVAFADNGLLVYRGKDLDETQTNADINNVHNLIANSVGVRHDNNNLFSSPRANFLFTIDGLSKNIAQSLGLKRLSKAVSVSNVGDSDALSTLSVADDLNTHFAGESLIISVSADKQAAQAAGATPSAHAGQHSRVIAWDATEKRFKNLFAANDRHSFSQADVLDILAKKGAKFAERLSKASGMQISYNADTQTWTVEMQDGQTTHFSMDVEEDFAFFAELQAFNRVLKALNKCHKTKALVNDENPDFVAMTLSSLKGIANKYGVKSAQYAAAAHLVDSAIPHFVNKFAAAYDERTVAEVVLLAPQVADHQSRIATNNRKLLAWQEYEAINANIFETENGTYTFEDVAHWQEGLWLVIMLLSGLAFAIYLMASIDYSQDTLLYVTDSVKNF